MRTHCAICGNHEENKRHVAREMMFGYRDEFEYLECSACGRLQNVSVPEGLERYYGDNYYSVNTRKRKTKRAYEAIKSMRTRAFLGGVIYRVTARKTTAVSVPTRSASSWLSLVERRETS